MTLKFKAAGQGCRFEGRSIEVKGRVYLGDGCVVHGNVVLRTHSKDRIIIGDRVEIADYAMLHADDVMKVGAGTYIGPFVVIRDLNHTFQGTDVHWRLTPHIVKPITCCEQKLPL